MIINSKYNISRWGHGRSHSKNPNTELDVGSFEHQLSSILEVYGWHLGDPLIFAVSFQPSVRPRDA